MTLESSGHYLRNYRPRWNLNRIINTMFARGTLAFPPSAVVVQQKQLPDVSFYQGSIDWDAMRKQTDAIIIRGGQGDWEDSFFRDNWREAKERGMRRGIYWFYDDRKSPGKQASKLAELIRYDLPEMEVFTDWENSYGGAYGGFKNVVAFMQEGERLLPTIKSGFYSGYYWFIEHSNAITNASQYNYLKTKPLWLGWYTNNAAIVKIPKPWTELTFWQFGTPILGDLYGVETKEIDMSWFNGTASQFAVRYGGAPPPPPSDNRPFTLNIDGFQEYKGELKR